MAEPYRIVLNFNERAERTLKAAKRDGSFDSYAETVRHALSLYRALQLQGRAGFTEIQVYDPVTDTKRTVVCERSPLDTADFEGAHRK